MHLLYLDDSGSVKNKNDKYIILSGLSVFEQTPFFLSTRIDAALKIHFPEIDNIHEVEIHGTEIFSGRGIWRKKRNKADRIKIIKEMLELITSEVGTIRIFGAAIHKAALAGSDKPIDPMEAAFEQICSRFDKYLMRMYRQNLNSNPSKKQGQRGLIIFDKSSYETSIQSLAREFREKGHRWGVVRNISDVPMFVDSKATRMIQCADLIAYALRRYYENGDSNFIDILKGRFDHEGGVIHGLYHYKPFDEQCLCMTCKQK